MAKLSQLPAATALLGSEQLLIVQNGETRQISVAALLSSVIAPPLLAPFNDDFTAASNLDGRAGWDVVTRPSFASHMDRITAVDGAAGGTTGTAVWASHAAPLTDVRVDYVLAAIPAPKAIVLHEGIDETVDGNRDLIEWTFKQATSGGLNTGWSRAYATVDGSSATQPNNAGVRPEIGDCISFEQVTSGGVTGLTLLVNGRIASAALDISESTMGVPLTNRHGFAGDIGAGVIDAYQVVDRASEASISLIQPNHVVSRNAAGGLVWHLSGDYSGLAPSHLNAEVFDASTGSEVLIASGAIADLSAADGLWSGSFTASAGEAATDGPYRIVPHRAGLLDQITGGAALAKAYGPLQSSGSKHAIYGQSLATAAGSQKIISQATSAPDGSFWINAQPTSQTVLGEHYSRQQFPMSDDTTPAALAAAFLAGGGEQSLVIAGGIGGSSVAERTIGTATYNAMLDGLAHAGGNFDTLTWIDGQNDIGTAPATYGAGVHAIVTALLAASASPFTVLMCPINKIQTSNDEVVQGIRKAQWQLTQDYPAIYKMGPHSLDLTNADAVHLVDDSYGELMRRIGHSAALAVGGASTDRLGPSLASMTKTSATQVYCLFDLNGADSLELVNTGFASEYHGGMVFSDAPTISSGTIANPIYPTGAVVDASPSSGQQGITFTLPSIAGAIYAWAGFGHDPFNPNDTAAIQADVEGKASMIRAVRSGEPSVGLQPRFAANDYVSAS